LTEEKVFTGLTEKEAFSKYDDFMRSLRESSYTETWNEGRIYIKIEILSFVKKTIRQDGHCEITVIYSEVYP
jgi:hypothetical protein